MNVSPIPQTMRAWVQDKYGTSEVFELRELPVPEPEANQILVEVHATSINALDWHLGTGYPSFVRLQMGMRAPKRKTPGADVAGVVVSVGTAVTDFEPGDRVVGDPGGGGFGQYVAANAKNFVSLPESVDFVTAASIPVAGLTALQALRTHAGLESGQRVLINGASGGVGTFAISIAKNLGAEVVAVCSTGNVDQARVLGADQVVDYKTQSFSDVGSGFDVIVDLASSQPAKVIKDILNPTGTYLFIGGPKESMFKWARRFAAGKWAFRKGDQKLVSFTAEMNQEDLADILGWVAGGDVKPAIENTYSLNDAMLTFDHLAAGHSKGKSVVKVR